jgi:hypothetical protein
LAESGTADNILVLFSNKEISEEWINVTVLDGFAGAGTGGLMSWINFFHETKYIHLGFVFFYNSLTLTVLMDF